MSERPTVALHVWISGRVQGVFFRDATRRRALALGLAGWVKNLPEGTVEAVFVGSRNACDQALEFVKRGPGEANVTDVRIEWEAPPEAISPIFEVRF